jgi:hypothetical protein
MPVMVRKASPWLVGLVPALLILAASALAFYKVHVLGYNLNAVVQAESYLIEAVMEFDGHGSDVDVSMALAQNLPNQKVSDESFNSGDLKFNVTEARGNRRGDWQGSKIGGKRRIGYTASIQTKTERFLIDSTLPTTQSLPDSVARYVLSDSLVQADDAEITRLADSLGLSASAPILQNLEKIYQYTTFGLKYVTYSGTTDALTTYHLGEASCGGKSRLMSALARHLGIPARLVGGKILDPGQSTATHIWVDLFVQDRWVPFCPTNKYFAEIPANYLILYYGEEPFITHTRDINFKFYFNLRKRLVTTEAGLTDMKNNPLDVLNVWATFKRVAISLELLKIIIMLPIGILSVVFFRNIVGLETFGTFMPALIAVGFRDTGLLNGVLMFSLIVMFGSIVRLILNRFQLLHTPRLAIILSSVVLFILLLTGIGVRLGLLDLARVALFPMVIMTLTVERFSIISEESGYKKAIQIAFFTILVAGLSYLLMASRPLQALVISFPETILVLIALYIYIGRYSGFRVMELFRFRQIMRHGSHA